MVENRQTTEMEVAALGLPEIVCEGRKYFFLEDRDTGWIGAASSTLGPAAVP